MITRLSDDRKCWSVIRPVAVRHLVSCPTQVPNDPMPKHVRTFDSPMPPNTSTDPVRCVTRYQNTTTPLAWEGYWVLDPCRRTGLTRKFDLFWGVNWFTTLQMCKLVSDPGKLVSATSWIHFWREKIKKIKTKIRNPLFLLFGVLNVPMRSMSFWCLSVTSWL